MSGPGLGGPVRAPGELARKLMGEPPPSRAVPDGSLSKRLLGLQTPQESAELAAVVPPDRARRALLNSERTGLAPHETYGVGSLPEDPPDFTGADTLRRLVMDPIVYSGVKDDLPALIEHEKGLRDVGFWGQRLKDLERGPRSAAFRLNQLFNPYVGLEHIAQIERDFDLVDLQLGRKTTTDFEGGRPAPGEEVKSYPATFYANALISGDTAGAAKLRDDLLREKAKRMASYAANERRLKAVGPSEMYERFLKESPDGFWGTVKEFFKAPARVKAEVTSTVGAENLWQMVPAALAAKVTKGVQGTRAALGIGGLTAGLLDAQLMYIDGAQKAGYDPTDPEQMYRFLQNPTARRGAAESAALHGLGVGTVEGLSLGLADAQLARRMFGWAADEGVEKTTKTLLTQKGAARVAKAAGKDLAEVAVQAPVQAAAEGTGELVGSALAEGKVSGKDVFLEALGGLGEAGTDTFAMAPSSTVAAVSEAFQAAKAERLREALSAVNDTAANVKTRKDLPRHYQQLVQGVVDAGVDRLYVETERFRSLFQEAGGSAEVAAVELGVQDQLAAGAADIEIPLSTWTEKIVGSSVHDALADEVRTAPDEMSAREARERAPEIQKRVAELRQEAEKLRESMAAGETPRQDTPMARIFQQSYDQAVGAGRSKAEAARVASLDAAWHTTIAERAGIDPEEFWASSQRQVQQVEEGMAPGGGLPQFAGKRGVVANPRAKAGLALAERMAANGKAAADIKKQTGWHQGMDGKWRFEISDATAELTGYGGNLLSQVLIHPRIFSMYPFLRDVKTTLRIDPMIREPRGRTEAVVNPATKETAPVEIVVEAPDAQSARTTLLHEVQHAIQELEDFARGGSSQDLPQGMVSQTIQAYAGYLGVRPDELDPTVAAQLRHKLYWRLAGEIEARDTAGRADLTDAERAAKFPDMRGNALLVPGDRSAIEERGTGRRWLFQKKKKAAGSALGLKREKGGRYVGAPDHVGSSSQRLAALRKWLRGLALEGEVGRFWYENSSKAILALANGDVNEAEKIVGLIAIYSPNATVPANTSMALRAYHQWKAGLPINAGFSAADKKAEDLLRHGKMWKGIKTNNFYQNLMLEIDPTKLDPGSATMDMWMAIAFDYGSKTLDQGPKYEFARAVTESIGDELGWKAHQVQAAIWSAIKGRYDPIRKQVTAEELKKGIRHVVEKADPDTGKVTKTTPVVKGREKDHYNYVHKRAMAVELDPNAVNAASYDFSNAIADRLVQLSWETTPGNTTGVLPQLIGAPLAVQAEYFEDVLKVLQAGGKDLLAEAAGLPQGNLLRGFSAWEGDVGAGAQTFFAVPGDSTEAKASLPSEAKELATVDAGVKQRLQLYSAALGLVLNQKMVVWHAPVYTAAKERHNGFELITPRGLTYEEMQLLYKAIEAQFGTTELAPGYAQTGARVLNFTDTPNPEFQKGMEKVLEALPDDFGGGNLQHTSYRSNGDYVENNWEENPNGEEYLRRLAAGPPDLLARAQALQADVRAVNDRWAKRFAEPVRTLNQRERGGVAYGTPRDGSVAARGVHYSREPRATLSSRFWGTGIRDAAARRLDNSEDARIKQRLYFYVDAGAGIRPEVGVGVNPHEVDLQNLYDLAADPLGLRVPGDANATESAVVDAGFDGYLAPFGDQKAAVLLGPHEIDLGRTLQQRERAKLYDELAPEEIPQNTQVAYKLMKVSRLEPDVLFPLFAKPEEGPAEGFALGKWHRAEHRRPSIGSKVLAERPGIHAVDLPLFNQGKARRKGEQRVWVKVLMPAMDPNTQAESDASPILENGQRQGIKSRTIGPQEAYNYRTNPNATGAGAWPIAGSMQAVQILSDAEVEQILREAGVSEKEIANSMAGVDETAAARLNAGQTLREEEGGETLGEIRFGPAGETLITLFPKANKSTLIHEISHEWLSKFEALALSPNAPQQIKDDYAAIRRQLGVKDGEQISDEQHEAWARLTEAFLMEGKAPSVELEGVLHQFRNWLLKLYRAVNIFADAHGIELNDETRGIFNRMLASDAQIEQAQAYHAKEDAMAAEMEKLLALDAKQRARFAERRKKAKESAQTKNQRRVLKAYIQALGGKEEFAKTAQDELAADPVHQLLDALASGVGLSVEELDTLVGEDKRKAIAKKRPGATAKEGGRSPDIVAEEHGFESVAAMVDAILAAESKGKYLKRRVQEQVDAAEKEALDLVQDPDALQGEDAYHNEEQLALLGDTLAAIEARVAGSTQKLRESSLRMAAIRRVAKEQVAKMTLGPAGKYAKLAQQEVRAGKKVHEALKAGKFEEAAKWANQEALLHAMVLESVKAREWTQKALKKLKKAPAAKIEDSYQQQLYRLLERIGAMKPGRVKPTTPGLDGFLAGLNAAADDITPAAPSWSEWLTNGQPIDINALTFEQFQELMDLVGWLEGTGKDLLDGRLLTYDQPLADKVAELVAPMAGMKGKKVYPITHWLRGLSDGTRRFIANHEMLGFLLDGADGFRMIQKRRGRADWRGPNREMADRLLTAQGEYDRKLKGVLEALRGPMDVLLAWQRKMGGPKATVGTGAPTLVMQKDGRLWTPEAIIAVALNMGNAGNILRLAHGHGLAPLDQLAPGAIPQVLFDLTSSLGDTEWQAIQDIWDLVDSFHGEVSDIHQKLNHFRMPKIEAQGFTTPSGLQLRGGYYPAMYDPALNRKVAQWSEKDDLMNRTEALFQTPAAKSSFTKDRSATGGGRPLNLSLSVLHRHLDDVLRYVTHAPVVRDIDRITSSAEYADEFERVFGRHAHEMIRPALRYVARPQGEIGTQLDTWASRERARASAYILGLNLSVAMKQFMGIGPALKALGPARYAKAVASILRNPVEAYQAMHELSPYMETRAKSFDREVADFLRGFSSVQRKGLGKALGVAREMSFGLVQGVDFLMSFPVWKAAFDQQLAANNGDVKDAVQYADSMVQTTQASAKPVDLSLFQRETKGFHRLFSFFMTGTQTYGSRQRHFFRALKAGKISVREYAAHLVLEGMGPPILMNLLMSALWGSAGEDWEDPEEKLLELAGEVAMYQFSGYIFARDIAGAAWTQLVDAKWKPKVWESPMWTGVKLAMDTVKAGSEMDAEKLALSAAELWSYYLMVPAPKLARRMMKGWEQYQDGDGTPFNILVPDNK